MKIDVDFIELTFRQRNSISKFVFDFDFVRVDNDCVERKRIVGGGQDN